MLHAALTAAPIAQQCLHASLAEKLSDQLKGEQLSLDTLEGAYLRVPCVYLVSLQTYAQERSSQTPRNKQLRYMPLSSM